MSQIDVLEGLTQAEIEVLSQVQNGADVWGCYEASMLRNVQRKQPKAVRIVKAKEKVPGHMRMPYFGAIATASAKRALAPFKGEG